MNPLLAPIEITVGLGQRVMRDLDAMSEVARSVPRAISLLESLDRRAGQVIELGERIDARAESCSSSGRTSTAAPKRSSPSAAGSTSGARNSGAIGNQMLTEARLVQQRAAEVVAGANEMIAVLPTVRRAIEIGEPLEGAIERFARVVDRLPGSPGRSRDIPAIDAEPDPPK